MDRQEQRVQFVVAANRREKSLTALCQEFGISRPTGMLLPGAPFKPSFDLSGVVR